jgi:N-acetylneuraminate synthase
MMQNNRTYIIAEAGVNHNGQMDLARELVDQAAEVGADAVKFQIFQTAKIVHPMTPKANYQLQENDKETQHDLLQKLELRPEDYQELCERAKEKGIDFLSTPFDLESLDFLVSLGANIIKFSSGDLTYGPLLLRAAQLNKSVLISTGMATLEEIESALAVLYYGYTYPGETPKSFAHILECYNNSQTKTILEDKVVLFHCTSEYPAPFDEINLNALETMKQKFGLKVGYSDHSVGILVPILAVAKGATMIEKHFTLDKSLEGPDHSASIDPREFGEMVENIRLTEKILGSHDKKPSPSELKNKPLVRRGLYAAQDLKEGQILGKNDILSVRPESRLSPLSFWELTGKPCLKNVGSLESL